MPRSIHLERVAASTDAERFRDALQTAGHAALGDAGFTASGDAKTDAPARAGLGCVDFIASGMKPPPDS